MAAEPRPTRAEAEKVVTGFAQAWHHPDPADVCPLVFRADGRGRTHTKREAAISCEHNSQLIAWKRRKAKNG